MSAGARNGREGARVFQWERALLAGHSWLVYLFLYVPIIVLIVFSFNESRQTAVWQGFTFDWYGKVFQDTELMGALGNSLTIAAFSTVISLILGTLIGGMVVAMYLPIFKLGSVV